MFVDESAIAAILLHEDEREGFLDRMSRTSRRQTSVLTLFEAVLGTAKRLGIEEAKLAVDDFVEAAGIEILGIDADLLSALTDAHRRYGRGTGHSAKLNMGDCDSYALAKRTNSQLLHKGDDFARIDLA